ncbi:MAG: DEAD/DEAH box helicase [Planctomycetes bacterium]|nr:DEAD/DEAH box helicase [Planctomycetota bacterium]
MYFEPETPVPAAAEPVDTPAADDLTAAPEALRAALQRRGFSTLTAVQHAVLDADDGATDLRVTSKTGSGKTVALGFALFSTLIDPARKGPTTLIIAPTRELAMQVKEELAWLFADLAGVTCDVVTGGTSVANERQRLRRRPTVLVGTPGRLLDHLGDGALDLSSVKQLVLDEADQMLDLGFKDELDGILEHLPAERRAHLVSATFPVEVLALADRFQRQPLHVQGTAAGEAHGDIEHVVCEIGGRDHYPALVNLLLLAGEERTLVFVRTREDTATLADKLSADGLPALPLNGDLAQAQRTRTLAAFRRGAVRTLIATDVAARGIDVPDVTMVVHVDPPIDAATLVHRSGRTGRAGQKGKSVMFVTRGAKPRARRLYHDAGIRPLLQPVPGATEVKARQLARAVEAAQAAIAAGALDDAQRQAAAELLRDRDANEVVGALLRQSLAATRTPFDLQGGMPEAGPARRRETTAPGHTAVAPRAVAEVPLPPATGDWVRFRINWGVRDGADPRRILAHVCRRGDVDNRAVGNISLGANSSTFEIHREVAEGFRQRAFRPDRRDPHLFIVPDFGGDEGTHGAPRRGHPLHGQGFREPAFHGQGFHGHGFHGQAGFRGRSFRGPGGPAPRGRGRRAFGGDAGRD